MGDACAHEDVSGRWSVSDTQKVNCFLGIGPRVHLDVQTGGIWESSGANWPTSALSQLTQPRHGEWSLPDPPVPKLGPVPGNRICLEPILH